MNDQRLIWPFSLYLLIFAGVAAHLPYTVLYCQSLSFTGAQIGLIVGLAPLITLLSLPFVTGVADRTNRHMLIMSLSLLLAMSGLILYPFLKTFMLVFGVTILSAVSLSSVISLSDSATMYMLGERKELFGRLRLGGTIGFGVAATVVGSLVEGYGLRIAFWSAAAVLFVAFLVSQKLVHGGEEERSADSGRASDLLKNPHFVLFLLIVLSGGISFATINTYLFPFMKELGVEESIMGLALTIGTLVEIPVLLFANRSIKRFRAYALLNFSLAMMGLRLFLMAIAPNPTFVMFAQLLNGVTYPLLTVAAVTYADEHAPRGYRATAQGLSNAAMGGMGSAIGGFAGGLLIEGMGAKGMYFVICAFVVLILAVISIVRRALPPEQARLALGDSAS